MNGARCADHRDDGRLISAGGVVMRPGDEGLEVILVGRGPDPIWYLPKGTPRADETLGATAQREVTEETGVAVRVISPIGIVSYELDRDAKRRAKTVLFFLMEPTGGDVSGHDAEYEHVVWTPLEDAIERISFDEYREMLRKAATEYRRGQDLWRRIRAPSRSA